ncbi:uncharacterized protein LOC115664090 [Syzygium oleosum]|uniref:uncharacterized protein LOC115664090 n=1 Tax=Syzygium oleosum TaxID=219896 RepID=UPI0024BBB9BD|nr:uncharacterized protein LOC115664090 [Syzygium oleosum]
MVFFFQEHGDTIGKKALANWNDVKEFSGETFSDSMQKNSSSSFSSQVFGGQTENFNPIFAAPVGPEAPLANVGSTAVGLNGATALALPVQSQNTNSGNSTEITVDEIFRFAACRPMSADRSNVLIPPGYHGSTTAGLPTQCLGINLQNAMCRQTINSSSRMDYAGYDNGLSSEPSYGPISSFQSSRTLPLPEGNHVMEDFESIDPDDVDGWLTDSQTYNDTFDHEGNHVMEDLQSIDPDDVVGWLADSLPYNDTFDHGIVRRTSRGVIGWLKIKAVLQWGYFIRKRGVRIMQLDEPPTEVRLANSSYVDDSQFIPRTSDGNFFLDDGDISLMMLFICT